MNINMMVSIALIIINVITFCIYGIDKRKAIQKQWRIPEKTLLGLALIGGSIGAIVGMRSFHHKTKKPLFSVGVPIIIIIQVIVVVLLVKAHLSSGL